MFSGFYNSINKIIQYKSYNINNDLLDKINRFDRIHSETLFKSVNKIVL